MSDVREQDATAKADHPAAEGPAGRLAALFVDSKLTPLLVVAALILGLVAIGLTPREEEPQIVVPVVDLFVGLPGADPAEVESRVTLPLEKRMWEIPGVEYVYSASMPGVSMVTVRFYVGDDAERSLIKVYDQLAGSLDQIPTGATPPLVRSRAIDDVPIFGLTLWSPDGDRSGAELRRYAGELGRQLAALDEVSDIRVIGGERRQIRIRLDPTRLSAAGLDPTAVEQAITVQNAAAPAGAFEAGGREILVETGAFLRSVDEVAALVVGVTDGGGGARRPIRLDDIATVEDATEDVTSYVLFRSGASFDGEVAPPPGAVPAVTLTLAKRQGADAHRVAEAALARVEMLRGEVVPRDVELTITRDYGATADEKASELLVHLGVAVASVTLVLGFFLGWRGALVVFVSVPVSFALTLFVYYVFGYTLNRVTLFALIFVTGIVVDDSIIVVENIVRHLAMKARRPLDAALHAVSEVGNPTILATLTVIASVLPMAFVRGLMGPYMSPMPVGASLAMAFSLFVALIATPWFAYRLFKGHTHDEDARDEAEAIRDSRIYRTYARILRPLLDSRVAAALFLAATFALLIGSMLLVPGQGVALKMLPFDNKSELQVLLDLPEGTTLETTARVAREVADRLAEEPEVTDLQLYVGTAAPINFNGLVRHYDLRRGSHVADLQVNFLHKKQRSTQSHDLAKRLRPSVVEIAERHGAAAKVVEVPPGPPVLSTLVAEVYGPSEAERARVAGEIRAIFESTPGVVDIDTLIEAPQEKQIVRVDREKAALHGVPAASVVSTLRLALAGADAGVLHLEDELEPVSLRLEVPRAERSSMADLGTIRLRSMSGALIPLSELVTIETSTLQPSRHRKNLKPVTYVVADVAGEAESPVYAILDMSERVQAIELPTGTTLVEHWTDEPQDTSRASMKWDGEWHITFEVFRDLGAAFGAVLILIYFLIVGWFRSFKVPLVMMIAIPLSLVGILPGHWLFGAFFTATSMIGFIALAGIMVRNSVLLIDFIELSRSRGRSLYDAILEAGSVRFRPILLTAGTVVVGATVILFDPIFQGLAIALMFGAIGSTALTLVVVPLVYWLVEGGSSSDA